MPDIGDYMVVATNGWQAKIIRLVTRSRVNHAMILIANDLPGLAAGRVIEAQPGGAKESALSEYDTMPRWWSTQALTPQQRAAIVAAARTHLGAPYSWVDDACIAATDLLGVHVPAWVRRRLARPDRLMCSQLVDLCYSDAGIQLFRDGRLPGSVAPSDLLDLINGHQ